MWVVLGILCGLTLLLCIPVNLLVQWEDGAHVTLRWLFLTFPVYPLPPKKEKRKKKESEAAMEEKAKKPAKKLELSELAGLAVDAVESAGGALRMVLRNLRIRDFVLDAAIAGEDAAETAISFGKMQAVLQTAMGILQGYLRIIRPVLRLAPDFLGEQTVFTIRFRAQLTPLIALAAGVRAGFAFLGRMLRRGAANGKQTESKGAVRPEQKRSGTANERG